MTALNLPFPQFERLLLRGDSAALRSANIPDAAALADGYLDPFLPSHDSSSSSYYPIPIDALSIRIAHQCAYSASRDVTLKSPLLVDSLTYNSQSSLSKFYSAYIAGVALFNVFLRDNWAGPKTHIMTPSLQSDAAPFHLSLDGDDIARPAVSLYCLRAARFILVDSLPHFVQAGARLVSWWAARLLFTHQAILSNPSPTLQNQIFHAFASFLGPHVARTRHLYLPSNLTPSSPLSNSPLSHQLDSLSDQNDPDSLLPSPVQDGDPTMRDDEDTYIFALDSNRHDGSLIVLAYLELSLAQKFYYDADGALDSLRRASEFSRVAIRMSGEMGVRTKHQNKETAQLVARAFHIHHPSQSKRPDLEQGHLAFIFPSINEDSSSCNSDATMHNSHSNSLPLPQDVQVNDPDVLGYVKLSERKPVPLKTTPSKGFGNEDDYEDAQNTPVVFQVIDDAKLEEEIDFLTPLEQALALAHASIVRARNAAHVLTNEEMAPYVDLALRNAKSPFGSSSVVQLSALLLRVSFERDRGRYLERCMAQMEVLANFIDNAMEGYDPDVRALSTSERAALVLASSLPPRWELMKELAVSFGKIGLVKSAMEIFERLEYWDELIDCHRLIGNLGRAEALVREHLDLLDTAMLNDGIISDDDTAFDPSDPLSNRAGRERAARRPRLLCVLGDITRDRSHFETAWTESGKQYARAKRALARWCVERELWEEAVGHFRDALALNPLFPDTWFTYGCAAIHTGDLQLAANAFTTVVQQTPENGEAWNNLGRVLHDMGKTKEALKAIMEAGKLERSSWQIWANVVTLATKSRSSLDIVRGLERLLELRGKDGVVTDAIGVAVAEVIRMSTSDDTEDKANVGPVCRRLLKILARCTAVVSTNASVWAAYAELHELVPEDGESKQKAFDCRLKQVRSLIAHGEWKTEKNVFRHMAIACDAMTKDAIESSREGNVRIARLQVDSVLAQTIETFKGDVGFTRLTEVRRHLDEEMSRWKE